MIQANNLSKSYADRVLFDETGFILNPGERIGLLGRNGSGKTTLFRMILGEEYPDSGTINIPYGYRIGHVSQHISFSQPTVLAEACLALPQNEDGRDETYRVKAILEGLGMGEEMLERDPSELSGGFQVRLNLAKSLVEEPDLLLLDEPTNYLDIISMRWLERFLRQWRGELIIITHDRSFMDEVTTHTMGIHRMKFRKFAGGTEKYTSRILDEEEHYERTRMNDDKKRREVERFINRFRAQATKASAVQSRVKALARSGQKEKLARDRELDFSFSEAPFSGKRLMDVRDLSFSYPNAGHPILQGLNIEIRPGDRIAVIGKNGRGKTTLLSLLADEMTPTGGEITLHPNTQIAYFGQTNIERLNPAKTIYQEIMDTRHDISIGQARAICGAMMFEGDDAFKKIRVLSGGERSRVLLGKLLVHPANLLLLDEPTHHLDMSSVDSLLEAIDDFKGAVIIVTHSELILDAIAERLIIFDSGTVRVYDGTYRDFLERIGWSDEGPISGPSTLGAGKSDRPKDSKSRKENKRAKAALIAERSKIIGPLKERMTGIEAQIVALEAQEGRDTHTMMEASAKGDGVTIQKTSMALHDIKKKMDKLFVELEAVSREHEVRSAEFETQIQDLE